MQIQAWDPNTSNTQDVQGRVTLAGKPVSGVAVRVDGWVAPVTDRDGLFTYPADNTMPARHVVSVASVTGASVDGRKLTQGEQNELEAAKGGISVGYSISHVSTRSGPEGTVILSGQIGYGKGLAPHPVQLYSYELTGTVTDANGTPVKGAIVTTRTGDHKFWTFSAPTGANGKYTSFLVAADQEGDNPVPMAVAVSVGANAYTEPVTDSVNFPALQSSRLDIQLPSSPGATLVKSSLNPSGDAGRHVQRSSRRGGGGQERSREAGARDLARCERPLRARASRLCPWAGRQVLGEPATVLLDDRGEARRERRPVGLSVVAGPGHTAGDRNGEAPGLTEAPRLTRLASSPRLLRSRWPRHRQRPEEAGRNGQPVVKAVSSSTLRASRGTPAPTSSHFEASAGHELMPARIDALQRTAPVRASSA